MSPGCIFRISHNRSSAMIPTISPCLISCIERSPNSFSFLSLAVEYPAAFNSFRTSILYTNISSPAVSPYPKYNSPHINPSTCFSCIYSARNAKKKQTMSFTSSAFSEFIFGSSSGIRHRILFFILRKAGLRKTASATFLYPRSFPVCQPVHAARSSPA